MRKILRKKWKLDSLLSQREATIAILVYREYSNKRIADLLHVSLATVRTHILHLRQKLTVCSKSGISGYIGQKIGYIRGYKDALRNR